MGKRKQKKNLRSSPSKQRQIDSSGRHEGFYGRKHEVLLLFCLAVLVLLIYSNTLGTPFIFDDLVNIQNNTHIRLSRLTLSGIADAGFESGSGQRPVSHISFALNYYFHQYDAGGYHVVNILIHLATGILLYFLIKTTLNLPSVRYQYGLHRWLPFSTALIWLVHPLHTQSVTYIVQRMNSMAAMFYVLSLFLYARARLAEKRERKVALFTGCIFAGVLALGSKQIAATLPFFILLYEWYFFQDLSKDWLRRHQKTLVGIFVFIVLIASLYLGMSPAEEIMNQRDFVENEFTYTERVLTQFRVVIHYISLLIFPHPSRLNLDYDFSLSHSLIDPITTLLSILAIAALIALAIYFAKRERLLSFCVLWFLGNLVIESSLIPLAIIYEHRTYLPSVFLIFMFVVIGYRYMKPKWLRLGVACVVVLVFSLWAYERNGVWSDDEVFSRDCVSKSPKKARPHQNLGFALEQRGKLKEAMTHYSEALQLKPDFAEAHTSLGAVLQKQGRGNEAISHHFEALRLKPDFAEAHNNLGAALERQGRVKEAVSHYSEALQLKPDYAEAHYNLAGVLMDQEKFKEAMSHYSEALRIKPDYEKAHYNLGVALMNQERFEEAASHFSEAVRINPDYFEAHYNLGVALVLQGDRKGAAYHFSQALRIDPGSSRARLALEKLSQ